jgi:hypothetical protein
VTNERADTPPIWVRQTQWTYYLHVVEVAAPSQQVLLRKNVKAVPND